MSASIGYWEGYVNIFRVAEVAMLILFTWIISVELSFFTAGLKTYFVLTSELMFKYINTVLRELTENTFLNKLVQQKTL
jgi:hypothetical protein